MPKFWNIVTEGRGAKDIVTDACDQYLLYLKEQKSRAPQRMIDDEDGQIKNKNSALNLETIQKKIALVETVQRLCKIHQNNKSAYDAVMKVLLPEENKLTLFAHMDGPEKGLFDAFKRAIANFFRTITGQETHAEEFYSTISLSSGLKIS